MTAAIDFSAGLFGSNDFDSTRQTIDISGDGSESNACVFSTFSCASLQNARDAFATGGPLGAERTINAIGIDDRDFFGDDAADSIQAVPYGLQNVVTANHSFNGIPGLHDLRCGHSDQAGRGNHAGFRARFAGPGRGVAVGTGGFVASAGGLKARFTALTRRGFDEKKGPSSAPSFLPCRVGRYFSSPSAFIASCTAGRAATRAI